MSRKNLTLAEKIALLEEIRSLPPNTSHRQLAEITGSPKCTITRLIQQEDKLREEWALCEEQQDTCPERKGEETRFWRVGPILRHRSEEADELVHEDFKEGDDWLPRWKSRYDIKFNEAQDEKNSADTNPTKMRRDLTLAERIALLDEIKSQPPNTSRRLLAVITGRSKSTIARLIQQEDKLREEWALLEGQRGISQKRKRRSKDTDVDETLDQGSVTEPCVRLGPILRNRSEEAEELLHEDFKGADDWLSRWQSRHDVIFKKVQEKNSADTSTTKPRKDLTLAERIALLDEIRSQPPNTSHRRLAAITGRSKSTIARLIQQEDKLREEWVLYREQMRASKRWKRNGTDADVGDTRFWRVGPILRNRSEETDELVHEDFKGIDDLLPRWKSRHDLKLKKAYCAKDSTDDKLHYKSPAKMRKDLTLAVKIALLDQIKSQPPNTSHRQIAEITGKSKSTIARLIQQQDKLREEWESYEGHQETRMEIQNAPDSENEVISELSLQCYDEKEDCEDQHETEDNENDHI